MQVSLDGSEQKHLREIAARIVKDEPALIATEAFGENTSAGMTNGPILIIGDHREIALSKPTGCELYEYRLSLLAREGDLVAISGGRSPDFEAYREDILKLGAAKYVEPRHASVDHSVCLADRCRLDERAFHQIVKLAKRDGSLTIVPHIGMGSAWVLAGTVEKASGCEVRVAAPPPSSVGAHFGITPKRYASGETDRQGSISKCGDGMVRTALYEAANALRTHFQKGAIWSNA